MKKYIVVFDNDDEHELSNKGQAEALIRYTFEHNPDTQEAALYKLQKVAKRSSEIVWIDAPVLKPPTNGGGHYAPWTEEEDSYLINARQAGMSYAEIARAMNRTTHAVEVRASRLCG